MNKGLFEASYGFIKDIAKQREKDIKDKLNQIKRKVKKRKRLTPEDEANRDRLLEILNEESNLVKTKNR